MSVLADPAVLARRDADEGIDQVRVGAVIDGDGDVLVVHRPDAEGACGGWWELPSGTVEHGEDLLAALRRAVTEETGLVLAGITRYLGEFDEETGGWRCRQHTWAITIERTRPARASEYQDFAWIAHADGRAVSREARALIRQHQHQHHTPDVPQEPWPLAHLVVRSPRLELRPDDDAGLRELALLGAGGVHPAEEMPMGSPWTDEAPQRRARNTMQAFWHRRGSLCPQDWGLNWLIRYRGQVIGTQLLYAQDFHTTREVGTGSWLGLAYQGRGFGLLTGLTGDTPGSGVRWRGLISSCHVT